MPYVRFQYLQDSQLNPLQQNVNFTFWRWGFGALLFPKRWGLVPQRLNKGLGALESNFGLLVVHYVQGWADGCMAPALKTGRRTLVYHQLSSFSQLWNRTHTSQAPTASPGHSNQSVAYYINLSCNSGTLHPVSNQCYKDMIDVNAPRSRTSRKQKTLGVSAVNTDDASQDTQWHPHSKTSCKQKTSGVSVVNTDETQQPPPGPKLKTPQSQIKSSGRKLSVSVDCNATPDTTSQITQLSHPAPEAESTEDVLPDFANTDSLNKLPDTTSQTSQPSHPASEAQSPGDFFSNSALDVDSQNTLKTPKQNWHEDSASDLGSAARYTCGSKVKTTVTSCQLSRVRVWCPPLTMGWGLVPQLLNKGCDALESNIVMLNSSASNNIAYWDDPGFYRRRMSGFGQNPDSDVPSQNTVGAESNEEDDALQVDNIVDESSSSGSNFSADERKHQNAKKQKYAALTKYLIMHSPLPDSSPRHRQIMARIFTPHPLFLVQKGKGCQHSPEEHRPACNSAPDVEATEEELTTFKKKCGPMPRVAWDKARDLTWGLLTAADQLAKEFGRSRCDILIATGLGVTTSHKKRNNANTYRSWYWNTQEIPSGKTQSEINKIIDISYRELFKGVAEKDVETRKQLMVPYNWWLDEHEEGGGDKDIKSVATRIQWCKDQMASMAESWSNLEDLEVVGAVMYIGDDPAGAQTSGIFGGSENVRGYIDDNHVNLRQMLSTYMMVLCYRWLQGQGNAAGLDINIAGPNDKTFTSSNPLMSDRASLHLCCQHKEIARDCNHQEMRKVPASSWLSAAYKHTMFIALWPLETKFPGPNFSLKNRELRVIVGPYLKHKLGAMYDDERPEGKEEEKQEFEILPWEKVASAEGYSLWELGDCEEWKKVYQLAVKEKNVADVLRLGTAGGPSCSSNKTVAPIPICPPSSNAVARSRKTPAPMVTRPPLCTTNIITAPFAAPIAVPRALPRKVRTEHDSLGRPSHSQHQDHTHGQGLNEQPSFNSVQGGYEMGDREVVVDDLGVEDTLRIQQRMNHTRIRPPPFHLPLGGGCWQEVWDVPLIQIYKG
ncbi:uncharacterized protein F5891DRAFT_976545 [Suillus fuscotomentosus]|uniref:Uncharacterized protein n=1 Tax=Suillus fuscotomentosus TaxID=1912939 RepID=A0AAD4HP66_9AGAM|nr:uncharacterized protein F5891DRAFT_976545 [Suillus fuscotomentosus]KAG1904965.1 hypothetical protein F5891DRAFT_976545 [Suillus fuscotomentosus]